MKRRRGKRRSDPRRPSSAKLPRWRQLPLSGEIEIEAQVEGRRRKGGTLEQGWHSQGFPPGLISHLAQHSTAHVTLSETRSVTPTLFLSPNPKPNPNPSPSTINPKPHITQQKTRRDQGKKKQAKGGGSHPGLQTHCDCAERRQCMVVEPSGHA